MPRNLSATIDLVVHLVVMLVLIGLLSQYNFVLAIAAFILWLILVFYAYERCKDRAKRLEDYVTNVLGSFNETVIYALKNLPQAILVIDKDGRLEWCNKRTRTYSPKEPDHGLHVDDFWPGLLNEKIFNVDGEYIFASGDNFFKVRHKLLKPKKIFPQLIALYVGDITPYEKLKIEYTNSRTVIIYVQIDNYDEVTQGLNEADKTALMLSVNEVLDTWINSLAGFMRKISDDLYVVVLQRRMLNKAISEKFDVLDKMRQLISKNKLPVTLSMGVSVADKSSEEESLTEMGIEAQKGLDLALGRGGDQVAVKIDGKSQFFGGRAKAVEKHTRVKARVVANAVREAMENADKIFIMGHHNEDFDCFGAAIGVAAMAKILKKPFQIVLSDMNEGIDKLVEILHSKPEYEGVFIKKEDLTPGPEIAPLLFVVDTHIPHLVAAPQLLERIPGKVIVIDHHRRSENFIKNPLMVYLEPSASSASELVTELLMYFDENIQLSRLDATAIYAGIVVDTKHFAVQTGARTFDAASYLRRSGADPVVVRDLFKSDYETTVALALAKARSEYYEGGLIISYIDKVIPNVQVIASQTADSLLRVENVRMSIVCFQLKSDVVGISARSTGELNVQVIMEEFGGGGHQNVAGAQVKNIDLVEVKARLIHSAKKYIEETDAINAKEK
ncbi:MAG: DHH family phosphoesterase [Selenomonadaceae bacterium]|nr:DHH family phosphoesterase [Selenomonadaceae bacterium]